MAERRRLRWWERPENKQREGRQGRLATPVGKTTGVACPECGQFPVVYNGNYFCDNWSYPADIPAGDCDWALAHPATSKRDREFCDLIGVDY